ncbi:hypothetical protein JL107_04775 [Nakamurella flavida]|uniref:Uncharacterized protein n=1 Tax=Nakamurella flavida TaxID=363630 RepID=A0A939C4I6_9ACTN|nr:hypothetical protein [Nakamurella flavida]MBM9475754.1 hypothetical protein [Nakamurella flavida]MDP9777966.1 uncharacterized membrane protein HdeD (DUF308 family) [Nakamurella flavida]
MSSASGAPRKRPGFLDTFRAAMTPPPLPEDTGGPLVRPRSVTVAMVLALLAGAILLFVGVSSALATGSSTDAQVTRVNEAIATCNSQGIGTGPSVVVPTEGTDEAKTTATNCQALSTPTADQIASAKRFNVILSLVVAVLGVAAVAGGILINRSQRRGRTVVVVTVGVLVAMTLFLQVQNPLLLLSTLLLVVGVMLTFIGRGNLYFVMLRRRGAQK